MLFTVTSTNGYYPPPPGKSGLKLVCNVNIVYGNLKSENSQDFVQKPQRNCTLMNSAFAQLLYTEEENGGKLARKSYAPFIWFKKFKSEKSQDFAQKPQLNCMFMNSASGKWDIYFGTLNPQEGGKYVFKSWEEHTRLRVRGWGVPIPTTGE